MRPPRPTRLPGFDYRGRWRYSLTFCTADRHTAFTNPDGIASLTTQLLHTSEACDFEPIAYCFMSDHLHLLVQGRTDDAHLPTFCRLLRQRLGHLYARRAARHLWQPGYYERVLRESEETQACVLYILANPVRAGLARAVHEYPFAGGTWIERIRGESPS